jgi:hypothetical protein
LPFIVSMILKERGDQDWFNVKMTRAKIKLVYIVATRFFMATLKELINPLNVDDILAEA